MSEERRNEELEEPEIIFEPVPVEGNETEVLKELLRVLQIVPMGIDGELNLVHHSCGVCVNRPKTMSESCPHEFQSEECVKAFIPKQDVEVKHPWLLELADTVDRIRRHHRHQLQYGFDKPRRRTT